MNYLRLLLLLWLFAVVYAGEDIIAKKETSTVVPVGTEENVASATSIGNVATKSDVPLLVESGSVNNGTENAPIPGEAAVVDNRTSTLPPYPQTTITDAWGYPRNFTLEQLIVSNAKAAGEVRAPYIIDQIHHIQQQALDFQQLLNLTLTTKPSWRIRRTAFNLRHLSKIRRRMKKHKKKQ